MDIKMDNEIIIGIGGLDVSKNNASIVTLGLGSCIGIALYDSVVKIGGLSHVMLPDSSRSRLKIDRKVILLYSKSSSIIEKMNSVFSEVERYDFVIAKDKVEFGSLVVSREPVVVFIENNLIDEHCTLLSNFSGSKKKGAYILNERGGSSYNEFVMRNINDIINVPFSKEKVLNFTDIVAFPEFMRFADKAISALIYKMENKGAIKSRLVAKIAGGAHMFGSLSKTMSVGDNNIDVVKDILKSNNIKILFEEVGGAIGRSVRLDTKTGDFYIKSKDGEKVV
jgi:chemotaxis receptor (MCP) glutamine deamidase CheD